MLLTTHRVSHGYSLAFRAPASRTSTRAHTRYAGCTHVIKQRPIGLNRDSYQPRNRSVKCRADSLRNSAAALYNAIAAGLSRIAAFFAAIHAIWKSWPGTLLRLAAVAAVLSTIAANALAVPLFNARAVPAAEAAASAATRRAVSLSGVQWVSPPGLLGVGPLVRLGAVSVGPGPVERSEGTLGSATVSVRPLRSVLQRRVVLDVDLGGVHASLRQADNFSWFGFPDDTEPSSRNIFPPADGSAAAPGNGAAAAPAGGPGGAAPQSRTVAPVSKSSVMHAGNAGGGGVGAAGVDGDAPAGSAAVKRAALMVRAQRELVRSAETAVAEVLAAAGNALRDGPVAAGLQPPAAAQHAQGEEAPVSVRPLPLASASAAAADAGRLGAAEEEPQGDSASLPAAVVRRVTTADASIDSFVFGDTYARQFRNVAADLRLGRGYRTLGLEVTGDANARDPRCLRCTMPTPDAPRNLRSVTEGAEEAVPANTYPITQQGPSPASLAAYAEGAEQRKLQNVPASFGAGGINAGWIGGRGWEDGFGDLGGFGGMWEGGVDARLQRDQRAPPTDVFSHPIDGRVSTGGAAAAAGSTQRDGRLQRGGDEIAGAPGQPAHAQDGEEGMGGGGRGGGGPQGLRGPVALFPPELLSPFSQAADNEATFPPFGPPFGSPAAEATDSAVSAAQSSGGRVTVRVSAREMMREGVWPVCEVSIGGENLHAPLIERLFELPMDIYGGRCDGELQLLMLEEDDWNVFPQFGGRVAVRGGAFHFWDAPDDFSETDMDLRFEGEMCHLVGGRGRFGAIPLRASGRLGMNPETGQYDLRAEVLPTDANAVRATLGARPLPYPIAGAVQGQLTCYGALETPVFSGRVRSARDGRWAGPAGGGGMSDAEAALRAARAEGQEAHLAYDKVALQDAEALFTFTAAAAELRVPALEARPLGGGRVRGAAAIAVDPAAEQDPRALQAEFSARGLDPALARAYLPALQNAECLRDTVGRVSVRGNAVGSHAAPVIRAAVEAPHCGSQAVVVLRRDSAAGSLRAPALLVSGTVLTSFPPFEEQKLALTQAEATAMAQPHVTGARGLLDVRGLDLQPLMQALEDPAAAAAPAADDGAPARSPPLPARLRGQLKLWLNERSPDAAAAGEAVRPPDAAAYDGSMELQGLRVNQMQLAHGLKGDFSFDDGRFQLDADGFWAYEKLRVDLNLPGLSMLERLASLEGLLGEDGAEASGGRVADGPANEFLLDRGRQRAGGSSVELQHGNMRVSASVDSAMEQVEVKADGLPLEKLSIGGVKGTLRNVDMSANLRTRAASATLDLIKPHLQGAQAENLHAEAELADGLLSLRNTRLRQAASTYDVDGEYRLWPSATAAAAAAPAAAPRTAPAVAGGVPDANAEVDAMAAESRQQGPDRHAAAACERGSTAADAAPIGSDDAWGAQAQGMRADGVSATESTVEPASAAPAGEQRVEPQLRHDMPDETVQAEVLSLADVPESAGGDAAAPEAAEGSVPVVETDAVLRGDNRTPDSMHGVKSDDAIRRAAGDAGTTCCGAVMAEPDPVIPVAEVMGTSADQAGDAAQPNDAVPAGGISEPAEQVAAAPCDDGASEVETEAAGGAGECSAKQKLFAGVLRAERAERRASSGRAAELGSAGEPGSATTHSTPQGSAEQDEGSGTACMGDMVEGVRAVAAGQDAAVAVADSASLADAEVPDTAVAEADFADAGGAVTAAADPEAADGKAAAGAADADVDVAEPEVHSGNVTAAAPDATAVTAEGGGAAVAAEASIRRGAAVVPSASGPGLDAGGSSSSSAATPPQPETAATPAAPADSGSATATEPVVDAFEPAWWVRVRAHAQLQDIVPTVETVRRRSTRSTPPPAQPGPVARSAAVDDVLGMQGLLSGEDASRGGFAGEFAARADSIRAEFARTVDAASLADADGVGPLQALEGALAKRVAEATWFVGDPIRGPGPSAAGTADTVRLPGLSSVTGRVKGELEARGGGQGASSVRMGVQGAEWRWGPVLLDEVLVDAALDEHLGLKIEQLDVKSHDGATMSMKGSLLGEAQDAALSIDKFPLATLDPLVRAALPSLHTPPRTPPAPLGPLAKPLSALQGYAYRAADALSTRYGGGRLSGAAARGAAAAGAPATATSAPIRGLLHASGTLSGSAERPAAALSARVDAASLGAVPLSTAAATATLDPSGHVNVSAELVPASASGSLALAAEATVPDGSGLDASLTVRDAGLAVLTEFTGPAGPKWQEGSADVRLHARGSVATPALSGSAAFARGRLAMPHLREPLTGVAGTLVVERDVLKVKDLKAAAGDGRVTAKGRLPLTPQAAKQDPRARLDMSAQSIEVKHPALLGAVDASVAATGSAAAPALTGELRVSRGAIIASGTFAPGAAAPAAGPTKPADAAAAADSRAELLRTLRTFTARSRGGGRPAAAAAEAASAAASGEEGLDNVALEGFRVILGPDLRVTWFPFLQVSLSSPGVVVTGPAVPARLRVAGEVEVGPGNVNVFATQFSIDRNRRNAIIFPGEDPGAEPLVDIAMASREFRFAVAAPLRDAPRAITITRLADGATQAVAADAPEMLAAQLRALLLEDDGRLAVQSMLANAVSAVLPRIEGSGRLGNAHWRLVGAPTPLLGNEAAGMFLGAQAEAEMSWGARWKVLLSSRHLADAQLSTSYQLAPGVRVYGGYRAPRSALTLMLDFGDSSSGLFGR